jgi:hypothetical protein
MAKKAKTRATPKRRKVGKAKSASPKQRKNRVVAKGGPASLKRRKNRVVAKAGSLTVSEVAELDDLRRQLERTASSQSPMRWNADPDEVQRSVAKLVLTLVEFVRRLLERQAIRRMEGRTLDEEQIENVGRALMQLEETVAEIAAKFGVPAEDLNLDLGPVGKLL